MSGGLDMVTRSTLEAVDGVLPGVLFEWHDGPAWRGFRWLGSCAPAECGVPREQLLAGWEAMPLLATDRAALAECLDVAVLEHAPWSFRGRFVARDGSARWWRANARYVGDVDGASRFIGQLFDIDADVRRADEQAQLTERLRREVARSEERFDLAISASNEGVFDWDLETRSIFYTPTVGRLLGTTTESLPRSLRGWRRRLDKRAGRNLVSTLLAQLRSRATRFGTVVHVEGARGARVSLEVNARMLYGPDGRPRRVVGMVSDVTARLDAERSLISAMDEADAANRSKSEFLARMSHELRTPLNSIIGFSRLLDRRSGDRLSAPEREQLQRIASNGMHLLELINDVLDLSKIEAGRIELHVERVDLGELLEETARELEGTIGARPVELRVERPPTPVWFDTDASKLRQVLVNLIGNALKFTTEGQVRATLAVRADGRPAWFEVRDTGIGIARDQLDRIFLPFEQAEATTARRFGGTGLGLSIVQKLSRLLGGTIEVESTLGVGSQFRFVFGAGVGATVRSVASAPPAPAPARRSAA